MSIKAALCLLAELRISGAREAEAVLNLGVTVIESGWVKSNHDEAWTVLEQVTFAAAECGNFELAEVCVSRLATRFPASPRVATLQGAILEAKGSTEEAETFYRSKLADDPTASNLRKRLIALNVQKYGDVIPITENVATPKSKLKSRSNDVISQPQLLHKGLELLVEYLETYYNDPVAWMQLATCYANFRLYSQSNSAMSHAILLAPHNPYYLLRHAETAYTIGDHRLAYKEFLRVLEMSDGVRALGGVGRRSGFGVKLCIAKLKIKDTFIADLSFKETDRGGSMLFRNGLVDSHRPRGENSVCD